MTDTYSTIGFIGGGNMGEAILGALIAADRFRPPAIRVSEVSADRRKTLQDTYGITVYDDVPRLFSESGIVVLATKPQQMDAVLTAIAGAEGYAVSGRKLVISIAAGVRIQKIEDRLYAPLGEADRKRLPVIRVMPNTPALVRSGISGMSPNRHATPADTETARQILSAAGEVIEFAEADLDAVTALSGSGPAYVFYLIEAMTQAGVEVGLDPDASAALTVATVEGAVRLLREKGEAPEELRRKVTSPGGTTAAAVTVLEENQVRRHIVDAIAAAARRADELSR